MSIARYVLAAVVAATVVTATVVAAAAAGAGTAASGADHIGPGVTAAPTADRFAPAAGLLPHSRPSGPDAAVAGAVAAADAERDRLAAVERAAARRAAERTPTTGGSVEGCAERAMAAGRFDPSCSAYQGYLDPGTVAGRAPTSGEIQMRYACEQGLVPESDC